MKAVGGRRRALLRLHVAGCVCIVLSLATAAAAAGGGPLGPSERPEAYFNGSSYIRLSRPISLKQLVGLSYRTCVGGGVFSQRYEGYTLQVSALFEQVVVSWARPAQPRREVGLSKETLDNRWHWVALRYRPDPPELLLEVDRDTQVISNVTWNAELLRPGALEAGGAVVLVGNVFSGCVREGPQLEFHPAHAQPHNVLFGRCPLATDDCQDRKDVLREPPKDHCYNEPCMRHGTCISRHDRYECHCTARYTGNNCEVDAGSACRSAPCLHGGQCVEDATGDYSCVCTHLYHGPLCELEVSLHPLCGGTPAGPCLHNGSCSVPAGSESYVCACPPGYAGRNCEIDVDECAAAGPRACLNGGRCQDATNNYTCDCTNTGYKGARCEVNVDECSEDPSICGHGVCYDTYGGFVCACQPLYTGERCHQMSACASGPCGAGGVCVEEAGGAGFRCVCARGWAPPLCAEPIPPPTVPSSATVPPPTTAPLPTVAVAAASVAPADPCADVHCPKHSHCKDSGMPSMVTGVVISKQVTCVCDVGYFGAPGPSPNCSTADHACESALCLNGGSCARGRDNVTCVCPPHYKGQYCEVPAGGAGGAGAGKALQELKVSERCASTPPPCLHAAHCHDQPGGGVHCECEAGWGGARCDVMAGEARGGGTPPGDMPPDCRAQGCAPHQECVESPNGAVWRCSAAAADSACASAPCRNGTCLALDGGLFRCQCPPGYNGRLCEVDVDECSLMPVICNHGVCVNVPGSYQCYCRPGYTGDSCEQDIDECLSAPCRNGGTCRDLQNNYECSCRDGFAGKDCSVNIDECESGPCAEGATCVDGVAGYACVCPPGLTGARCDHDIDDCQSSPCLHGGRCVDALNGFSCECAGTGYSGPTCDVNIDECLPRPCQHGGSCHDLLNDYACVCHPGYTGKNCETDIVECASSPCQYGGVCLERSNTTLYVAPDAGPIAVGAQPHMLLPAHFYQPFTLANASGYECVCVAGTSGARCEVNIDECASSPCGHGKCVDGVGEYACECLPGYEGDHCQLEIDECQRYAPCQHGRCYDGRAMYYCQCEAGWGGVNCSVVLTGCQHQPCRHRGHCHPWLQHEHIHRFNCSCANGYYGTTCEKITTMSLEKTSYAEVNTSREEGYDISFRFKTTLGSGLLAMGRGLTYFFLELSHGRLNLHSSLLNKWEGVFIGSNLNDSNWQKVFVTINASHLVLAANEEQTIYPISQNEAFNASVTSFPSTRLGAPGSGYAPLTHGPHHFVGCFQDVVVNSQWVLPEDSNATSVESSASSEEGVSEPLSIARARLRGVLASCPRTPQCAPSPCQAGGHCEDAWTSFVCTCPRPYLGHTCQYNYTAATFGHEAAKPRSVVMVAVLGAARRAVHAALDISMFVRTRKPSGTIFYLGSLPRYGQSDETLVGASLKGGELLVHLRFNHTPEDYTVGGTRLDNGHLHLIQVVRNSTLVQVKLNGTEYFRKSISAAKQLDAQVLYLGGPPPIPVPESSPATPAPPGSSPATPITTTLAPLPVTQHDDADYFKGVIQDVQVSNGMNITVVEFFPLDVPGLVVPPPFGAVTLDPQGVLPGVVSDDACASRPCLHNATCQLTWNDYTCQCPRGYKGKQCAEVEFCQLQACPLSAHCRNLDGGYECVSNATFDGVNTTLSYRLRAPAAAHPAHSYTPPHSITITYRSKVGGTLLYAEGLGLDGSEEWFSIGLFKQQVAVQWRLGGQLMLKRMLAPRHHHGWSTLRLLLTASTVKGVFVEAEGHEEPGFTAALDALAWQRLMTDGVIHLGGVIRTVRAASTPTPTPPPDTTTVAPTTLEPSTDSNVFPYTEEDDFTTDNLVGEYFKGCMGAVHVGELLLPFFTEEQLLVGGAASLLAAAPRYALVAGGAWGARQAVGCLLCLEAQCLMGGRCADVRTEYHCACPAGYTGDYCQVDIDECAANECANGATCQDGVAAYTCVCAHGYEGDLCEHDIDECVSSPCANGGTCVDGLGAYRCECGAEWRGPRCLQPRTRDCSQQPCAPRRGLCHPAPTDPATGNNYTCECLEGYVGAHCEDAFCDSEEPCEHGQCRPDDTPPMCQCEPGYTGRRCERERDECVEAGPTPCLHGGHCHDTLLAYTCDCSHTGWRGARCEVDVDECAEGLVSCGPGECRNTPGSYTCLCTPGFCGVECALRDPCVAVAEPAQQPPAAAVNGSALALGPCEHGGVCEQRCAAAVDYVCHCVDGWGGKNCSQQVVADGSAGGGVSRSSSYLIGIGAALLALAVAGAAAGAVGAQARRKRATRGTYSPSGQEYCNPRAESMHHALKPPPEERLI